MKKHKTISKLVATAAVAVASIAPGLAQTNLGISCGCPLVASRPTKDLALLADASGNPNLDGNILKNLVLTCDTTWILSKKIYVPDGMSITIKPGTLIRGNDVTDATALIVTKGGKIFAEGTPKCPIVFTAALDPMDGTYCEQGKWGGVVLLGKAKNNLTAANVGGAGFGVAPGIGFIEGFTAAEARNQYGMAPGSEDDNDNSGVMHYVSIRHAGDVVGPNNELNGLSLGSVGRGTTLDHIEVLYNFDDGFEFFGGTVDLKYATVMYSADDSFDWDQGWRGRGQFWLTVQSNVAGHAGDNGFECDNDDQSTNATPFSNPIISNATCLGNGGDVGIEAKEATRGSIYNSVFANFGAGLNLAKVRTPDAYNNWIGTTFNVKNCTFVAAGTNTLTVNPGGAGGLVAGDAAKFTADGNTGPATVAGLDFTFSLNCPGGTVGDKYNAVPNPALGSVFSLPLDGFFTPVDYRGAFKSGEKSWMSDWAFAQMQNATVNLLPCPTDVTGDGTTSQSDLNAVLGQFGSNCQ